METETKRIDAQTLESKYGVKVNAEFVPWSQSRSFVSGGKLSDFNLNWKVTISRNGRDILTTDYSAGQGHCPSYKPGARATMDYWDRIKFECEKGKPAPKFMPTFTYIAKGETILTDPCDVMYSLILEASVLGYPTFESWASEYGYDLDSRKAESLYRDCLEIALKVRNAFTDEEFRQLQEEFQDF